MKKSLLMKSILLLFALVVGTSSSWAGDVVGTINFGSATGSTKIQGSSSTGEGTVTYTDTGDDSQGNTWTITTVTSNDKSFTQDASYSQVGASKKPVTSITFTTTLPSAQTIKAFSAKFGGFNSTAGTVTLKVGDTTVGSGSLNGTNDVTVSATNTTTSGTVLTVTVTGIAKGVKCYYISYTYESSVVSSSATFANKTPSVNWPANTTFTQTATTAEGYAGTAGASVTYSIGSTNTCEATINASTGEVSFTKSGTVIVNATAAEIAGHFSQSSDSYTLTVNDARETPTLSWSSYSVEIFKDAASYTLPTLNNPNSLEVTYSVTGTDGLASVTPAGVVTVNTGTVGTATVKATFEGNSTYKARTTSYTINVVDPTVKGSKYNPYTVAEVIAENPTSTSDAKQSDVYVKGYIVGCCNGSNGDLITNKTEYVNTNLALADDPDDPSDYISVQLSSGTNRTKFNVVDHPEHVGKTQLLIKADIFKYCGIPGLKNIDEMTKSAERVSVTDAGWATYVTTYNAEFAEGDAFVVSAANASTATLAPVTKIGANKAVLLKGEGAKTVAVLNEAPAAVTNLLQISTGGSVDGFVLAKPAGKSAGFYKWNGGSLTSGKVYLPTPAGAREFIGFDSETTAIGDALRLNDKGEMTNDSYFNLAGQRVAQPTKGLYIVNGKKVIIK